MDYYQRMKGYYERRAAEYDDAYLGTDAYSRRNWPGLEEELDEGRDILEVFRRLGYSMSAAVQGS
jgi:hypothetical protein